MQEDAIIYTRVSSERQAREGSGLGSQETRCREYAHVKRYNVRAVFSDDVTGGTDDRPGLRALISYLNEHPQTIVLIDDISRLARDFIVHIRIREAIREANGRLESPSLKFGEDPDSKLIEHLLAIIAQHHREKNRDQVRNRMGARLLGGFWPFRAPRGYQYEQTEFDGKLLVPCQPIAPIVQEALNGFASGRFQAQVEIQRFFSAHPAFPRPKGEREVKIDTVREILENVLYTGYLEYPSWGVSLRPAKHKGLITMETFRVIQERLAGKSKTPARADLDADFPLRGVIACAKCGHPMGAGWTGGRSKEYPYYFCQNKKCELGRKSIPRDEVEERFEALLHKLSPSSDLVALATDIFRTTWDSRASSANQTRIQLQREKGEVGRQINLFVDRILATSLPEVTSAYEQRIRDLKLRQAEIEEQLRVCQGQQPDFDETFRTAIDFLASPWKLWDSDRLEDRRAVLKLTFAGNIQYCKEQGFRTAETTLPFNMLEAIRTQESGLVEPIGIEPTTS